jgi:hypothetical protein
MIREILIKDIVNVAIEKAALTEMLRSPSKSKPPMPSGKHGKMLKTTERAKMNVT